MSAGRGPSALTPSRAGAAAPMRRLSAQTAMELRLTLRNGESLLVTFGIPVGLLVFFSLVEVLPVGVDFLVPGVLALSVMSAAFVSLAIATGFERAYLVLKRLGATPLRRSELIGAKILAVLAVEVLQVLVVLALGRALGWSPPPDARLALAPVALVLGTAAFAGLGLTMAGQLRAVATLALANAVYLALLLISGIAFPLDVLPAPLAAAARLLPSAALAEALRAALSSGTAAGLPLLVLTAWAVAGVTVAARGFRWE